jgi:hypothetical protein
VEVTASELEPPLAWRVVDDDVQVPPRRARHGLVLGRRSVLRIPHDRVAVTGPLHRMHGDDLASPADLERLGVDRAADLNPMCAARGGQGSAGDGEFVAKLRVAAVT